MNTLTNRTTAFLIRSRLEYNIYDLCRYIDSNHKGLDCNDIRKKFVSITTNGINLNNILTKFIVSVINDSLDKNAEIPDDVDIESMIEENIDIFFEVEEDENDVYLVECTSS